MRLIDGASAAEILRQGDCRLAMIEVPRRTAPSRSAPSGSVCATVCARRSRTASTSTAGGRSSSRSTARSRTVTMSIGRRAPDRRLRRVATNLAAGCAGRPAAPLKSSRLLPPTRRLAVGALAGSCWSASRWRSSMHAASLSPHAAARLVDSFNEITDFGRSAWFLVPLAGLILLAAAPRADRRAHRQSRAASLVVRLTSVPGDRVARTVRHRHQGPDRARAPLDVGPFAYLPWSWQHDTRACRPGTRPRPLRPRSRSRAVAAGPNSVADLRRGDRVSRWSSRRISSATWSPPHSSALRRDPGAQLVCGARARFRAGG